MCLVSKYHISQGFQKSPEFSLYRNYLLIIYKILLFSKFVTDIKLFSEEQDIYNPSIIMFFIRYLCEKKASFQTNTTDVN